MVHIVTKNIKGNEYLYLVESIRNGSKIIQKTIKYIGRKRPIPKEEFECMKLSHSNKDWILHFHKDYLSYQHHEKLKKKSKLYQEYLTTLDKTSLEKEQHRFLSRFIANSNAIEGSTLTPNETYQYLFEQTIPSGKTKKELHMTDNLFEAWKYIESHFRETPTISHLLKLHALVNKGIEEDSTLGKLKSVQNYIGDKHTTSYLFIEEKLQQLLEWIQNAKKEVNDFEIAFQSHAQFEFIHPFVDGNGRVGRLLLNWLLLQKKLSPLAITVRKRSEYIVSLENATRGNVRAICEFCFEEYINQYDFVQS